MQFNLYISISSVECDMLCLCFPIRKETNIRLRVFPFGWRDEGMDDDDDHDDDDGDDDDDDDDDN